MSKKINIPLSNIRYQLHDLFHEYLEDMYSYRRMSTRNRSNYDWMDDEDVLWAMQNGFIFQGMDDDMANYYGDDNDGECVWPPMHNTSKKRTKGLDPYGDYWDKLDRLEGKKKHRRGNKKKHAKVIDIHTPYSGMEDNSNDVEEYDDYYEIDSSGIEDGKEIWFYPDYSNKSDRLEFNTLSGFSDFCAEQGYHVPSDVGVEIAYRRVSHTCLEPTLREEGIFQIVAEESYGDMRYRVCPVEELSQ